jgi:hypothetical protein
MSAHYCHFCQAPASCSVWVRLKFYAACRPCADRWGPERRYSIVHAAVKHGG